MADAPLPRLPLPRALLLDAMGTLIGLRGSVGETYAQLAEHHGIQADPDALNRALGPVLRQAPPMAFPGVPPRELAAAECAWWCDRIVEVFARAGVAEPLPAPLGPALFDHFADPALWRVYPDVIDQLPRWRARGLRLAVVSNFDQRLDGLLEGLGLAGWFDTVAISSRCGAAKPDPRLFHTALEALALAPTQVWHVGDSPEDRLGAQAAGIPCLLIQRPGRRLRP